MSQYLRGKTSLDLYDAGEPVALAGPYSNNLHLAPDR